MLAWTAPAWAQEAPVRVRGTITKVDGNTLAVTARNGTPLTVRLTDNARVVAIVKASLADIKQGGFVGTTALPQPDGSMRAVEVHIFPEAMRGTGEGHRDWDLQPSSTMTNGTVAQAVAKVEGNAMTVKYKDGEKTVLVTPETAIVTYVISDRSELKPEAKIFIGAATRKPDGTLEAERVNVGRDGITPPM
jgi:hypothetical protein